ncbi:rhodanese-related sulfurtransferase [Rhodovulum imhoffii]|uniref:Rhodanese-related sulfurtransferase n=1 Tax=Rhodovulum imhoffii TaxID=365340 RepID=A0A2T5BVQ4_9RHOB|nr:rhodanese-like domain-containing protein [Rhodovulum imhoffii]MBK5933233.1 hypothetical protein [Rhodovulum imhoffii]PTN03666.1 rhodanese-related sulfurtransferase [Rhodovulum imhoffii]
MIDLLNRLFPTVPGISAEDAIRRAETGEVVLLDIRKAETLRETGKARGAVNVPVDFVRHVLNPNSPYYSPELRKDRPVVVYGDGGQKSTFAARTLLKMGFEVYDLNALRHWINAKGPIER